MGEVIEFVCARQGRLKLLALTSCILILSALGGLDSKWGLLCEYENNADNLIVGTSMSTIGSLIAALSGFRWIGSGSQHSYVAGIIR